MANESNLSTTLGKRIVRNETTQLEDIRETRVSELEPAVQSDNHSMTEVIKKEDDEEAKEPALKRVKSNTEVVNADGS